MPPCSTFNQTFRVILAASQSQNSIHSLVHRLSRHSGWQQAEYTSTTLTLYQLYSDINVPHQCSIAIIYKDLKKSISEWKCMLLCEHYLLNIFSSLCGDGLWLRQEYINGEYATPIWGVNTALAKDDVRSRSRLVECKQSRGLPIVITICSYLAQTHHNSVHSIQINEVVGKLWCVHLLPLMTFTTSLHLLLMSSLANSIDILLTALMRVTKWVMNALAGYLTHSWTA